MISFDKSSKSVEEAFQTPGAEGKFKTVALWNSNYNIFA